MMLLLIMILLVVIIEISFYTQHQKIGIIAAIALLLVQGGLLLDSQSHFGTTTDKHTQISQIKPIASIHANHIMIIKTIKQGKTHYKAFATKKPGSSKLSLILNKDKKVVIQKSADNPSQLLTTNTQYHYNNSLVKFLFTGVTSQGQLKRQVVTYQLNQDWAVLSKQQLKSAATKLKSKSFQARMQAQVKTKLTAKIKQDPKLLKQPKQLKRLQNELVKKAVGHELKQFESF
ncbi:MAG: DUF4811 domain-containing protein [Lentilactobacillus diolivorans]|uniref:DUF4811 domain-containing protein n=1 Tax=Lentilactobacillus diolivorans TaxID=179838 RepID=UPI0039EA56C8